MKSGKRGQLKIIKSWLEKKGLYICDRCRGEGKYKEKENFYPLIFKTCEKCSGTGITDWITKMRRG